MGAQVKNYGAYLLCGLIPWTFLQNAVLDGSQSLLSDYGIIKKVYMPREVIPLSYVVSNFIHCLLGWGVYFAGFCILLRLFPGFGTPLLVSMLWFPVITLVLFVFVGGLALWVSALNVFYEDVKFIVQTLFRLAFFLLPILYPVEKISGMPVMQQYPVLLWLYRVNPITAIITTYRKTLLQPMPPGSFKIEHFTGMTASDWIYFAVAALISLAVAASGYAHFNRRQWQFVERP